MKVKKRSPRVPVRIGIIGLGQIALKAHLPGYTQAAGCQVTAIHSQREEHAKQVATQYGIPIIYKDWTHLVESDQVDAVSICTPNFTHAAIAIRALRAGKHVMVEKPMTMTRSEALEVIRAAGKAKKVLMVHHNMRFDPAVRSARKLLARKVVGDILTFKGSLTHRGPEAWSPKANWFFDREKSGGGALMDLGPHVFGALEYLLDSHLTLTGALLANPKGARSGDSEVHCAALLRAKSGAIGTVNVGWADTTYQNRYYFFGTQGTLSLNLAKGEPITLQDRGEEGKRFPDLDKDSFAPSIYEHFLDCIRSGKTPWVSGEEGLRTVELIEAGYRMARHPSLPLL
ncbi:MAG TPA: Gfo/Idh/MocA family oxidoreductase [bacterium]|nr:Gfo/Idh/MocA family oxidoreductase [bacterium]